MFKAIVLTAILAVAHPFAALAQVDSADGAPEAPIRPVARSTFLPATQWDHREEGALWTRVMMSALAGHGSDVVETVPSDIAHWCPAYAANGIEERRAFWVGLMSAVAHYESRHIPDVVGAGRYYGLLQIYPPTARAVDCRAGSGDALRRGVANLNCAVRIMNVVVPDHEAVAVHDGRWRGIANQWGPMTRRTARGNMADWTRVQDYCAIDPLHSAPRPPARPLDQAWLNSAEPGDGSPSRG